jgi:hypothetical protein
MTNYGLKDRYVTGTNAMSSGAGSNMVKIWLGDSDAAIDPSSSSLTSYISALGEGSGLTWIDSDYPLEYDSTTGLWSRTFSIVQMYWDYTSGSNNEYVIKEIGMGKTRTTLWTHALIYDEHGDPSSIVKRPNTRLYVTTFITASLKVSDIQQMYLENKFLLMTPYSASPVGSLGSLYWRPLSRGNLGFVQKTSIGQNILNIRHIALTANQYQHRIREKLSILKVRVVVVHISGKIIIGTHLDG